MRDFKPMWFVAGAWAIDLYLDEVTRPHGDIEIGIFRKDQIALHDYLDGWRLQKVVNGVQSVWHRSEALELPVHELYCFNETADPQQFEALLNESNDREWIYRRNQMVRRSLAKCMLTSNAGVKFLCPEVVLLYKSKNPRAKDEHDFSAVVNHLEEDRRAWLKDAITVCEPEHHWLQGL